ncbi:MAG: recombinase family protein [Bacteroidales bacterium]
MKSAVIYSRVSSTTDRQSTERQVLDLKSIAEKNDFKVCKVFEEKISGAKKNEERNILMECVDYCVTKNIDCLLTSELSRIGRSTLQVLKTLDILHTNKVNVYVQNLGLNTLNENKEINPLASIIITVLAEMSAIEKNTIAFRLNSGRQNYIDKGGKLGRKVGSEKSLDKLKEEYKDVLALLKRGYSIRNTAKLSGRSISTIQRVKKTFNIE